MLQTNGEAVDRPWLNRRLIIWSFPSRKTRSTHNWMWQSKQEKQKLHQFEKKSIPHILKDKDSKAVADLSGYSAIWSEKHNFSLIGSHVQVTTWTASLSLNSIILVVPSGRHEQSLHVCFRLLQIFFGAIEDIQANLFLKTGSIDSMQLQFNLMIYRNPTSHNWISYFLSSACNWIKMDRPA